jgi:hypothetical protein
MGTSASEDQSDERGGTIVEGAGVRIVEIDLDQPTGTVERMRVDVNRGVGFRDHAPPAGITAQTGRSDDTPSRQVAIT